VRLDPLQWEFDQRNRDRDLIRKVEAGRYEYFVEGSLYFSIEPLVALRPGIEAVAIPSLGVNYRPMPPGYDFLGVDGWDLTALALQLTLGGALNPSSDTDGNSGAIGFGFSYPIAGSGAFSVGVVAWNDAGDRRTAPYISVTLGDFANKVSR